MLPWITASLARLPRWLLPRGRRLTQLALGVAALLFVASLTVSVQQTTKHQRLEARAKHTGLWFSSQALVELHRFHAALHGFLRRDSGVDRGELFERYEIMLSRQPLVGTTEGLEDYAVAGWAAEEAKRLLAELEALEPFLLRLDPDATGRSSLLVGIEGTLDHAEKVLGRITLDYHLEQRAAADEAKRGQDDLHWTFVVCTGGLVLSAGLLVALLLRESRRARLSLGEAQAAGARAGEAERTLRVLIDSLPAMVSAFDPEGRFLFTNEAHARFHGIDEHRTIGCRPTELGLDRLDETEVQAVVAAGITLPFAERMARDADGVPRTLLTTKAPVSDGAGGLARVVHVALDITDRKQAEDRIRYLAEHDALTDLPNRHIFVTRLAAALEAALERGGMLAVHCLDLDRFKEVNDNLGHPAGDALLLAAAGRMRGCLREGDMLARLGGDEFAVIQHDLERPEEAEHLATRLVAALERPFEIEGYAIRSGTSIGCALGPRDGASVEALLQRADIALYRAKGDGRGRWRLFSPEMEVELAGRREMEAALRAALDHGNLSLVYQPKFAIASGAPTGCEALVRWLDPKRGWVPPMTFVPLAEEMGLAWQLSRWVLEHACRQARAWQQEGLRMPVAVNLSALHFGGDHALELVRRALDETGAEPGLLEVEVTESVFIHKKEPATHAVAALRAMGVRVALDDFGTGYSSLSYLQHLPFDVIKIDRSFVRDLERGGTSRRIVEAILGLAHGLGAKVVAEGVETTGQLRVLAQMGCDQAQGFLLGRPMEAEQLATLLRAAEAIAMRSGQRHRLDA